AKRPWRNHLTIPRSLTIHLATTGLPHCDSNTWRPHLLHPRGVFCKAQGLAGGIWRGFWAAPLGRGGFFCIGGRVHHALGATTVPDTFLPSLDTGILNSLFETLTFCLRHILIGKQI